MFLKASIAAAALLFAHQACAQVAPSDMSGMGPQPLIGSGPLPTLHPGRAIGGIVPAGDPAGWVSAADYPDAAVADKAQGFVSFRLEVDDAGLVSGCRVTKSSGSQALDKATCSLMRRRGRFLPGRTSDNEPAGGSWAGTVKWDYPEAGAKS